MNTRTVPVEPTEEMIAAMYDIHPCGPTDKLTRAYKAALAAAPPQPEQGLVLPDIIGPCSEIVERITSELGEIEGCETDQEIVTVVLHALKRLIPSGRVTNVAPEQADQTPRESDAQPESLRPEPVPAAAPDSDLLRGELGSIIVAATQGDPVPQPHTGTETIGCNSPNASAAAPICGVMCNSEADRLLLSRGGIACGLPEGHMGRHSWEYSFQELQCAPDPAASITSSEAVSACSRCGKTGVALNDGHTCVTFGGLSEFAFCGTLTGTLTADGGFTTNNAAGQVDPVKAISTGQPASQSDRPVPAAPTTMNLGERADSALPLLGTFQWAQGVVDAEGYAGWKVLGCASGGGLCLYQAKQVLVDESHDQDPFMFLHEIAHIKHKGHDALWADYFTKLCLQYIGPVINERDSQAHRVIELEQQVADAKTQAENSLSSWLFREKELEQHLAEKDRGYAILHGQFVEMRNRWRTTFDLKEKAEAELAELRKDAATIASMIQNVIVERRVK